MTADDSDYEQVDYEQTYDLLESRLKLYTGLWFATLTNANYNLQFTAILIQVFQTKSLVDLMRHVNI